MKSFTIFTSSAIVDHIILSFFPQQIDSLQNDQV